MAEASDHAALPGQRAAVSAKAASAVTPSSPSAAENQRANIASATLATSATLSRRAAPADYSRAQRTNGNCDRGVLAPPTEAGKGHDLVARTINWTRCAQAHAIAAAPMATFALTRSRCRLAILNYVRRGAMCRSLLRKRIGVFGCMVDSHHEIGI